MGIDDVVFVIVAKSIWKDDCNLTLPVSASIYHL